MQRMWAPHIRSCFLGQVSRFKGSRRDSSNDEYAVTGAGAGTDLVRDTVHHEGAAAAVAQAAAQAGEVAAVLAAIRGAPAGNYECREGMPRADGERDDVPEQQATIAAGG